MTKRKFRGALIDLDGTVFFKSSAIPGAREALDRLRLAGVKLRFLSNTDSITAGSLAERVTAIGVPVEAEEVYTSASAAQEFLKANQGKKCLCLLSDQLKKAFAEVHTEAGGNVDYVLVGDCRERISYEALNSAFQALMEGAELIVLQRGRYFMRDDGYNLDTGAFVAMFEYASGKTARVLGKPSREFFAGALAHMGLQPEEAVIVGDDLESDIQGAATMGMSSVLVKTGKFTEEALLASNHKPTWVLDSLADVPDVLL